MHASRSVHLEILSDSDIKVVVRNKLNKYGEVISATHKILKLGHYPLPAVQDFFANNSYLEVALSICKMRMGKIRGDRFV